MDLIGPHEEKFAPARLDYKLVRRSRSSKIHFKYNFRYGNNLETFTIVTTEPNELMRPIHNRMPVILRREDEEQWLDVSGAQFDKARSVLNPYRADDMDAHDVSTFVNKPENDSSVSGLIPVLRYSLRSCLFCEDAPLPPAVNLPITNPGGLA